ncbi:MAG: gluconokinase [Acidobacteriota bacterium]
MTADAPILTVDAGTSSLRAMLFDRAGRVLSASQQAYPPLTEAPGCMVHDPEALWRAFSRAVRACVLGAGSPDIAAVSVGTYLHAVMPVDSRSRSLHPFLLWGDRRAAGQARRMRALPRTGCPPHASFPIAKIRWFAETRPAIHRRAARWISPKAFLLGRLTGRAVEDEATASATGLYDIVRRRFSAPALAIAGIDRAKLPEVVPVEARAGTVRAEAVHETALPQGTLVLAGSGDGMLANLGAGAVAPGDLCVTIGTSAALRLVAQRPVLDPAHRLFCYVLDGKRYVAGGASNNGGAALSWCRARFLDGIGEDDLGPRAAPSATLFLPFLDGERAPDWDASLSGAIVGFRQELDPRELYLALVRGICFNLRRILERLEDRAGSVRRIVLSGGAFRSRLLCNTLADVLGRTLQLPEDLEASSRGGFVLASRVLGRRLPRSTRARAIRPQPRLHRKHDASYSAYVEACDALRPVWRRIESLRLR